MKWKKGTVIPFASLPEGYRYQLYVEGDEKYWADIMVSVGEFDDYEEAMVYFIQEYLPYKEELKRRLLFVVTGDGKRIGTLTNWWNYTHERRDPTIHYVGVMREYQGLGIGKALVYDGMKRMIELEGDRDFYLHTQTWSYKAITIYLKTGYDFVRDESFCQYNNDYDKALETIRDKISY